MRKLPRRSALELLAAAPLVACAKTDDRLSSRNEPFDPPLYPNETPELRALINKWADFYRLPRELVHKLAIRESTHRP